jgi:hypothetical protein
MRQIDYDVEQYEDYARGRALTNGQLLLTLARC